MIALWLAALMVASAPDSMPRAITLEEAVALANKNAPEMVQAAGRIRTTAAAVRAAQASFLPSLSLSAGASRQLPSFSELGVSSGPWSFSMGMGANLTLFDGGQRFFALAQANSASSSAEAYEVSQRYSVTLSVKEKYFNVLAARESETAAAAQLAQAEQQYVSSVGRVRAGMATRSDSLRAEIQVRNARLAVSDARNSLQSANASLARAVGVSYAVTAAADSTESFAPAPSETELTAMAETSPAIIQARRALDSARAGRRSAWTSYLPSLTAGYSRNGSTSASGFSPFGGSYDASGSVRLSLSFPLFNQLQREEQVTQARVAEENAAAALRDALLANKESLTRALGDMRSAQEHVSMQTATVESAQEDLRMQQQRYAIGASTVLDVLTSQTQLDQARRDLIRARYDRRVAQAEIEALIGRDL
jgi:outer membrane protein